MVVADRWSGPWAKGMDRSRSRSRGRGRGRSRSRSKVLIIGSVSLKQSSIIGVTAVYAQYTRAFMIGGWVSAT